MKERPKLIGWLLATLLCLINGFELTALDKPNVIFILSDNQSYTR